LLGGPIVHWAHENVGRSFGSLGIRVGAPVVDAGLGCVAVGNSEEFGCLGGFVLGGILGTAAAVAIDAAALAYESAPENTYAFVVSPVALPGGVGIGSMGTW
jgi:hypothetical protein